MQAQTGWIAAPGLVRVSFTDRTGQTAGVRYRYTGPVWPVTGRYWWNSKLNSKTLGQLVRTDGPKVFEFNFEFHRYRPVTGQTGPVPNPDGLAGPVGKHWRR